MFEFYHSFTVLDFQDRVDVTMVNDGKFHWALKFVRMTTKSGSVVKIDAFTSNLFY